MLDGHAVRDIHSWLQHGAPPPGRFDAPVSGLMTRLVAAGMPVDRFALFILTLHPTVGGRRITWTPDEGVRALEAPHAFFRSPGFTASPIERVYREGLPWRRRLDDGTGFEHTDFSEFVAQGFTDWYAQPLIFHDGQTNAMSFMTRRPGGFCDEDIAALDLLCPATTRVVEIHVQKVNTTVLLSTFVGRDSGGRILNGAIKRGDHERVPAAILFADLVGFTRLSNEAAPETVIERLNVFFDALAGPIAAGKGEILKFLGDGVLAIFPVGARHEHAGNAARAALAALTAARAAEPAPPAFRAALHAGDIFWGNVGAANRLDFTAIGPAVNLAARLLEEAGRAGADTLASAEFAALSPGLAGVPGQAALKGFDGLRSYLRLG